MLYQSYPQLKENLVKTQRFIIQIKIKRKRNFGSQVLLKDILQPAFG